MKKIIITGPESTGKSTLAKNLSNYLKEPFVPEFARYFLPTLKDPYVESTLLNIAVGQNYWHQMYGAKARNMLICDTGVEAVDIWFQYRFGYINPQIRDLFKEDNVSFYLLCKPDIPWEYDPLRETPNRRPEIFDSFISLLEQFDKKYFMVEGQLEEERLHMALKPILKMIT